MMMLPEFPVPETLLAIEAPSVRKSELALILR
jgi:hypothetical protein